MEEKKTRKKTNSIIRTIVLVTLAVLIAVFGALYAVSRTVARVRLSNLADAFDAFSVKDNSSFPYVTDAGAVVRMVSIGSGIGVLRTDKLEILTSSGAVLQSVKHTYTMPALDECGGRVLLYDRGGTRYMLLSKTKTLYTGETEKPILTAALSEDGRFAVATTSDNAKSLLTACESSGEAFFQYKCVAEYVTDIAFTQEGVALTVTGVKDAAPYSRLLTLHFKKTEPITDVTYDDMTLFHVSSSGSTVMACGDSAIETLRHNQQQPDQSFGSDTLQFFCGEPGGKATLVLLTYGNEHGSHLRGFRKNGEIDFDADCGQKLIDASRGDTYTCVLTDGAVLTYNNSGSQVGTLTLTQAAQKICVSGRMVYVLFNDHIEPFPAAGTHTQKTAG